MTTSLLPTFHQPQYIHRTTPQHAVSCASGSLRKWVSWTYWMNVLDLSVWKFQYFPLQDPVTDRGFSLGLRYLIYILAPILGWKKDNLFFSHLTLLLFSLLSTYSIFFHLSNFSPRRKRPWNSVFISQYVFFFPTGISQSAFHKLWWIIVFINMLYLIENSLISFLLSSPPCWVTSQISFLQAAEAFLYIQSSIPTGGYWENGLLNKNMSQLQTLSILVTNLGMLWTRFKTF